MSEESDLEKTEAASPRRLEKAREDGDVARSRELVTLVILGAGIAGIWLTSGSLGTTFGGALQHGLQFDRHSAFDPAHMLNQAGSMVLEALMAIAPFLGMMMLAALVGPLMLGGWMFSTKAIGPKFSKLDPLAGIGRMFSAQSLAELIKAVAKSLLVGIVAWWVISGHIGDMVSLMGEPAHRALPHAIRMVVVDCAVIAATLVIVAMIDVPYQLWSHAKKLRMSREDVRQEHKESEGDPHVKANIRRMQQQAAKRRMMSEVPKADIVVTNPTHFAVALKTATATCGHRSWWPRAATWWRSASASSPRNTTWPCSRHRHSPARFSSTPAWVTRSRPACTRRSPKCSPGSTSSSAGRTRAVTHRARRATCPFLPSFNTT